MNDFRNWYIRNQDAITWFLIGWLAMGCIDSLSRGQYGWAALDVVLIYMNYKFIQVRM